MRKPGGGTDIGERDLHRFASRAVESMSKYLDPVLRRWFSEEQLAANLRASMVDELERVRNLELASGFAGVCPVEGAEASDYLNVLVPFKAGEALLGIRFKGLDVAKPFVDVVATSVPVTTEAEVGELRDLANAEYSVFRPGQVRFSVFSPEAMATFGRCGTWEKKYLVGAVEDMRALAQPRNLGRVVLHQATGLGFFGAYLDVYRELVSREPGHADFATPDDREDFEFYLSDGMIFEVLVDGKWAGIIAGYGDVDGCVEGFRVTENVLSAEFRGRGFGRAVQRRLADALKTSQTVIFGTIHAENSGAYHAALRSGRVDIGGYCWVTT